MAVYTNYSKRSAGTGYSQYVDGPADYGGVNNSTFFYDVSLDRVLFKTSIGTIIDKGASLATANQTQTDATRTYDANSGVLIFDSLSQLKMIATVAPPLGSGSFEVYGKTLINVANQGATVPDNALSEGTFAIGNGSSSGVAPLVQGKGSSGKTGVYLLSYTSDNNAAVDMQFNVRDSLTGLAHTDLTKGAYSFREFGNRLLDILRNGNVGLGVAQPLAKLHVKSDSTSNSIVKLTSLDGTSEPLNITEGQTKMVHMIAPPLGEYSHVLNGDTSGNLLTVGGVLNVSNGVAWSRGVGMLPQNTVFGEQAAQNTTNQLKMSIYGWQAGQFGAVSGANYYGYQSGQYSESQNGFFGGANSGQYSKGANSGGIGHFSMYLNKGVNTFANGTNSGLANTADLGLFYGQNSGYYNNSTRVVRLGGMANTLTGYLDDNTTLKSFNNTNITLANNGTFTVTAHGFGTVGRSVNIRFKVVSGSAPSGMVNNSVYQLLIVDANTLQLNSPISITEINTGSYTFNRDYDRSDSVGIGWESVPTVTGQIKLGGTAATHCLLNPLTSAQINAIPRPTIGMFSVHSPSGKIATFNGTNWEIPTTMTAI